MKLNEEVIILILLITFACLTAFLYGADITGKTDKFIDDTAATIYANQNSTEKVPVECQE